MMFDSKAKQIDFLDLAPEWKYLEGDEEPEDRESRMAKIWGALGSGSDNSNG